MKTGHAYIIDWLDHCDGRDTGHAWIALGETAATPARLRSVGYLVNEGPEAIAIAHTMDTEHSSLPFTIVTSAIVRVTEIKLPPAPIPPAPRAQRPAPAKKRGKP